MSIFEQADPWEVSTSNILGPGNYVVRIVSAEMGTSSGGHPQIEIQLANTEGEIRDWLVITEASVGKVVALAQAANVPVPTDEDIEEGLRIKQAWCDALYGKHVGIVVREEDDFKDPTRKRSRVQGYVGIDKISGRSDIPDAGNAFQAQAAKDDKDLPF